MNNLPAVHGTPFDEPLPAQPHPAFINQDKVIEIIELLLDGTPATDYEQGYNDGLVEVLGKLKAL